MQEMTIERDRIQRECNAAVKQAGGKDSIVEELRSQVRKLEEELATSIDKHRSDVSLLRKELDETGARYLSQQGDTDLKVSAVTHDVEASSIPSIALIRAVFMMQLDELSVALEAAEARLCDSCFAWGILMLLDSHALLWVC